MRPAKREELLRALRVAQQRQGGGVEDARAKVRAAIAIRDALTPAERESLVRALIIDQIGGIPRHMLCTPLTFFNAFTRGRKAPGYVLAAFLVLAHPAYLRLRALLDAGWEIDGIAPCDGSHFTLWSPSRKQSQTVWFADYTAPALVPEPEPEEICSEYCSECGAPLGTGEGWDGLCGGCADAAYARNAIEPEPTPAPEPEPEAPELTARWAANGRVAVAAFQAEVDADPADFRYCAVGYAEVIHAVALAARADVGVEPARLLREAAALLGVKL